MNSRSGAFEDLRIGAEVLVATAFDALRWFARRVCLMPAEKDPQGPTLRDAFPSLQRSASGTMVRRSLPAFWLGPAVLILFWYQ